MFQKSSLLARLDSKAVARTSNEKLTRWNASLDRKGHNRERVWAYLLAGILVLLLVLCISFGVHKRLSVSDEIVLGAGNVLASVGHPGEDNIVARTILALPVVLRKPLKKLAVDFELLRRRPTPAKVMAKLPHSMQDALSWRSVSLYSRWHDEGDPLPDLCDAGRTNVPAEVGPQPVDAHTVAGEYAARHQAGGCSQPRGMWSSVRVAPVIRYKYEMVAQLFSLGPGQRVLDWGAGCGHAIDLLAGRLHFKALALDLVEANAVWAKRHLKHITSFCAMDGATLPFPSNSLDAVLSNGALFYVGMRDAQCEVLRDQMLRVLRPGGCAWLGFNGVTDSHCGEGGCDPPTENDFKRPTEFWANDGPCFRGRDDVIITTALERELFGFSEYDNRHTYSIFMCKKPPTSILTRTKAAKLRSTVGAEGRLAAAGGPDRSDMEDDDKQKHTFAQDIARSLKRRDEEPHVVDPSLKKSIANSSEIKSHLFRAEDIR